MSSTASTSQSATRAMRVSSTDNRGWMDVTGSILGHSAALSPLGADVLRRALLQFNRAATHTERGPADPRSLVGVFDGRAWLNLSALRGYLSGASLSRWVAEVDPQLAGILTDDLVPPTADLRELEMLPGLMFQGARTLAAAVAGQLQPARSAAQARAAWRAWLRGLERRAHHDVEERGLVSWVDHLFSPTADLVVGDLMPRIALATTAARAVREPFAGRPSCEPLLAALHRGLDGHVVSGFVRAVARRPIDRTALMETYGHRGEASLDVARPCFAEDPAALDALLTGVGDLTGLESAWERARQARKLAVATLASELTHPIERARFLAATDVMASLGGLSDAPLDALLRCVAKVRRVVRELVRAAEADGRLEPGAWRALSLHDLERVQRGERPQRTPRPSLPGHDVARERPPRGCGLVAGVAEGPLHYAGTSSASPPPPGSVWVVSDLGFAQAPRVAGGVAVVVTHGMSAGPAVVVAEALGRPCVAMAQAELPPAGTRVRVDGATGTVVVVGS